jgi:putative nucleotidyltransferase with HDIG domain
MTREQGWALVQEQVSNKNLRNHMLAAEAVMRRLAGHFKEDEEIWGLAGLVHDLDYDQTVNDFPKHGIISAEMLEARGVPEAVIHAVKSHPGHFPRTSLLDHALYAVDPVTGLIVAATLMHPEKKLKSIDADFIIRRFGEKRFAAGANREQIKTCETFGLPLRDFVALSLEAMQGIDAEIGL